MSYHLVVTRPFGVHAIGAVVTEADAIEAILAGPNQRSAVRVFEDAVRVEPDAGASEAPQPDKPDAAAAEAPASDKAPAAPPAEKSRARS